MGRLLSSLSPLLLLLLLLQPRRTIPGPTCPKDSYSSGSGGACSQCRVCDRNLQYKQKCTETANAVCECAPGYSCGKNCEACECSLGEQRTSEGCQHCPEKTFNDQRIGGCRPWKVCPDGKIMTPGTRESDVVCWSVSKYPTSQPSTSLSVFSTHKSEPGSQLMPISITLVMALLLSVLSMLFVYVIFRSWSQEKVLKPLHGQLAQEDDCTYRYPEEEEGGRSEAAAGLKEDFPEKSCSLEI